MQVLFGVIFHFLGGFASGSFYVPYRKVRGWAWESFWIVGGVFSWLIIPPIAAWLTVPTFFQIILQARFDVLCFTCLFGLLWGIGGLTYGLGVRYLGVSLGSTIILGLCAVFGSLIPALYYDFFPAAGKDSLNSLVGSPWGRMVLGGITLCVTGIVLCGRAGMLKEKELKAVQKPADRREYRFGIGILVAVVSGILSACFNFGIEAGHELASAASLAWKSNHASQGNFLFQNNVTYVVILWGGLATNLIWCLILNARNKTFGDYTSRQAPLLKNYIYCAVAGTTWFLQFFFYGMGESRLGNGASSWILHMAFIILVANSWGFFTGEWKGISRRVVYMLLGGIATIILSVLLVGYGNSIKP